MLGAGGVAAASLPLPVSRLTSQETEVLEMLAEGLSIEQIAERLFIGEVRPHVSNVPRKLRVPHSDAAVRVMRAQKD